MGVHSTANKPIYKLDTADKKLFCKSLVKIRFASPYEGEESKHNNAAH